MSKKEAITAKSALTTFPLVAEKQENKKEPKRRVAASVESKSGLGEGAP